MRNSVCVTVIVRLWGQTVCPYTECMCVCVPGLRSRTLLLAKMLPLGSLSFFSFFFKRPPVAAWLGGGEKGRGRGLAEDDESLSASQQQLHNYSFTGWMVCVERRDWFALMVCVEWWVVIGWRRRRRSAIATGTASSADVRLDLSV